MASREFLLQQAQYWEAKFEDAVQSAVYANRQMKIMLGELAVMDGTNVIPFPARVPEDAA